MRKSWKIVAAITAAVTVVAVTGGCDQAEERDLEKIIQQQPQKAEIYSNVNKHPNIVRLCIDGVAFYTTSRDFNAIGRVLEWDAWCKSVVVP